MQRRTNKHLSKKQRNIELGLTENGEERFITVKNARLLSNILIEEGSGDLGRAVSMLQQINDQLGNEKTIVTCSHCAKKIGVKRCAGCSTNSTIRYCSRDCQLAAWPAHRGCCGVREAVEVE